MAANEEPWWMMSDIRLDREEDANTFHILDDQMMRLEKKCKETADLKGGLPLEGNEQRCVGRNRFAFTNLPADEHLFDQAAPGAGKMLAQLGGEAQDALLDSHQQMLEFLRHRRRLVANIERKIMMDEIKNTSLDDGVSESESGFQSSAGSRASSSDRSAKEEQDEDAKKLRRRVVARNEGTLTKVRVKRETTVASLKEKKADTQRKISSLSTVSIGHSDIRGSATRKSSSLSQAGQMVMGRKDEPQSRRRLLSQSSTPRTNQKAEPSTPRTNPKEKVKRSATIAPGVVTESPRRSSR